MSGEELFPIVDENGNVIGKETRMVCHSGSMLLHPVVHLHVFNSDGCLFLQKRSLCKDIQPGKWDTSVGGHIDYGEEVKDALRRESREELGITDFDPIFICKYVFQSKVEKELVNDFYCVYDGKFNVDPVEIDEGRFWTKSEIEESLGKDVFTPNFEGEYKRIIHLFDELAK